MIEIRVYGKDDCSFCDEAKLIFDRVGGEFPLAVVTLAFDDPSNEALLQSVGALFPPAVFVDGEFFCYGRFSERRMRRELGRRMRAAEVS